MIRQNTWWKEMNCGAAEEKEKDSSAAVCWKSVSLLRSTENDD
jgi:hypothetical protein